MLMKCHVNLVKMAKHCIVLLLTMHVFSDFCFSHGDGLVAITEFVFHCVNLCGAGDDSMWIFFWYMVP